MGEKFLFSWDYQKANSMVHIGDIPVGGKEIVIAAGPCSIESEEQIMETAKVVRDAGATILRAGAFKPRTSPYSFQGLGTKGIEMLKKAGARFGMPIVSEMMDLNHADLYSKNVDLIQVGARNVQNFELLKILGKQKRPVLLKSGIGTTVDEWLMSSEYILSGGNKNVILCYRGARSIEAGARFSMDIGSIAAAKTKTHLPIAVDPSHAAGKREYVEAMALAAIAAGADMLEIEVHSDPERALSDKEQQLTIEQFSDLMKKIDRVAKAVGRNVMKPNIGRA